MVEAENLTGHPLGPGSRLRLLALFLGRRMPLEYEITAFERSSRVVFRADQGAVWSTDEIRFPPPGTARLCPTRRTSA